MPFRIDPYEFPNRTKIQFTTSLAMPGLIYEACKRTGVVSNTRYIQQAVAHALAVDLDIPVEQILADLPPPRGPAAHVWGPEDPLGARRRGRTRPIYEAQSGGVVHTGPANTIEEVKEYR